MIITDMENSNWKSSNTVLHAFIGGGIWGKKNLIANFRLIAVEVEAGSVNENVV